MKPVVSDYGNVDCRKSIPDGYQIIYDMSGSDSLLSRARAQFWDWVAQEKVEWYEALVGFEHVESQHFATAHFSKPAHYRPIVEVLIPNNVTPPPCTEEYK